ncbi:hypothetical protein ADICYQ_0600 [Cyclobacterium qasimii M12-11B]|uniref:Uncharacterized protein n=1 Tax=Cyclobacterium qasimii M12-11B TaxID=641524 RepID=S7X4Y1_9BACT|nr:hypothetical protein ADICYQ_0600 [Cyclobacterium qasimii M12-11B]
MLAKNYFKQFIDSLKLKSPIIAVPKRGVEGMNRQFFKMISLLNRDTNKLSE